MERPSTNKRMKSGITSREGFIVLIILIQIVLGLIYAIKVPLWMPSDERAHMTYVVDVMRNKSLPTFNYDRYESIQPPLYYLAAACLCSSAVPTESIRTQGQFLRIFGLVLFVASALLVFQILSFGKEAIIIELAAGACFALSPVMLAIFTTVTNDSLSFLITIVCIRHLLSICCEESPNPRSFFALGVICGLGLLTKLTFGITVIFCGLFLLWRFKHHSKKLLAKNIMLVGVPLFALIAPGLLWNWTVYHALTAYGSAAKSLVHGPLQIGDGRQLYNVCASSIAYHLLPTEFWLNQFRTPLLLRCTVVFTIGLACLGMMVHAVKRGQDNRSDLIAMSHPFNILFWLLLVSTISVEPVRGFLGMYCGFCYLCIRGLSFLSAHLSVAENVKQYFCLLLPVAFVMANLYLICMQIPHLTDYGLRPN